MGNKAKETVKLRFKTLKNGEKSAYFDIYHNGVREYVWQEEHLLPETDNSSIEHNRQLMLMLEDRRRSLIAELTIDKSGIANRSFNTDMTLIQWVDIYGRRLSEHATKTYIGGVNRLRRHIADFNENLLLKDLNEDIVTSFYEFMKQQPPSIGKRKTLGEGTIWYLMKVLGNCMNGAIRERLIDTNPCKGVLSVCWRKQKGRSITCLSMQELIKLIDTPFRLPYIKRVFLFSCFTGASPETIRNICWKHIYRKDGRTWAILKRARTNMTKDIVIPLTDMAIACLPPRRRAKGSGFVFETRKERVMLDHMHEWCKIAAIPTTINFVVAKNTYAYLLLNAGADYYTAGYMMGFSATFYMEEYAGYMNSKKYDSVNKLDNLLGAMIDKITSEEKGHSD